MEMLRVGAKKNKGCFMIVDKDYPNLYWDEQEEKLWFIIDKASDPQKQNTTYRYVLKLYPEEIIAFLDFLSQNTSKHRKLQQVARKCRTMLSKLLCIALGGHKDK